MREHSCNCGGGVYCGYAARPLCLPGEHGVGVAGKALTESGDLGDASAAVTGAGRRRNLYR